MAREVTLQTLGKNSHGKSAETRAEFSPSRQIEFSPNSTRESDSDSARVGTQHTLIIFLCALRFRRANFRKFSKFFASHFAVSDPDPTRRGLTLKAKPCQAASRSDTRSAMLDTIPMPAQYPPPVGKEKVGAATGSQTGSFLQPLMVRGRGSGSHS